MYYTIKGGIDGIGLDFEGVSGIFADGIDEARTVAAEKLRLHGYALQADKGLFTVHGHRSWTLVRGEHGYEIVPDDSPEPVVKTRRTLLTLQASLYAQRITDAVYGGSLTDATVHKAIERI